MDFPEWLSIVDVDVTEQLQRGGAGFFDDDSDSDGAIGYHDRPGRDTGDNRTAEEQTGMAEEQYKKGIHSSVHEQNMNNPTPDYPTNRTPPPPHGVTVDDLPHQMRPGHDDQGHDDQGDTQRGGASGHTSELESIRQQLESIFTKLEKYHNSIAQQQGGGGRSSSKTVSGRRKISKKTNGAMNKGFQAYQDVANHIGGVLNLKPGVKSMKPARDIIKMIKEDILKSHPDIDSVALYKKVKEHFDKDQKKYRGMV